MKYLQVELTGLAIVLSDLPSFPSKTLHKDYKDMTVIFSRVENTRQGKERLLFFLPISFISKQQAGTESHGVPGNLCQSLVHMRTPLLW